jgi:hypothetical protein
LLTVTSGGLELPKIFAEPLPLDFFTGNAAWTFREGALDVVVKNASFTNEHVAGSVSGTYRGAIEGRGSVDLSGALVRADARSVWRYVPASLTGYAVMAQACAARGRIEGHALSAERSTEGLSVCRRQERSVRGENQGHRRDHRFR